MLRKLLSSSLLFCLLTLVTEFVSLTLCLAPCICLFLAQIKLESYAVILRGHRLIAELFSQYPVMHYVVSVWHSSIVNTGLGNESHEKAVVL